MKIPEKLCPDCCSVMKYQKVEQEFEKEGMRVVVSGIPAWKCPICGAICFPPGAMDHVVGSARELFAVASAHHSAFLSARIAKT